MEFGFQNSSESLEKPGLKPTTSESSLENSVYVPVVSVKTFFFLSSFSVSYYWSFEKEEKL